MRLVVIESPYAGDTPEAIQANVDYGRRCLADSLSRGEAPFASHLLYTQPGVLDDANPGQRSIGIAAGLQWSAASNFTAVYYDRGLSKGMKEGLRNAIRLGLQVELRSLEGRQTLTAARCPDGSGYELRSPNWQAMLPGAGFESFVLLIKNWVDGALESSPRPAKRPHLMEEVKAIVGEVGIPTSEPVGEIEEDKEGYPWKRIGYIHAWRIADLPVGTKLYAAPQSGRAAELTAEVERLRKATRGLLDHVYRETCTHEETYRGGNIWEICCACDCRWADDEGGKPEFAYPKCVQEAEAALSGKEAEE